VKSRQEADLHRQREDLIR
jgi:peptidoglycan hydrolase CwlO-like protein